MGVSETGILDTGVTATGTLDTGVPETAILAGWEAGLERSL